MDLDLLSQQLHVVNNQTINVRMLKSQAMMLHAKNVLLLKWPQATFSLAE
jgi:hypothetical protein